ncbi:radical SAM/SPASM domain-containing protein [Umezawaea sp.]|uniref:radical SAM/SPASM domain-containing protein n=1 Tax=Umezawaea sp. TaxID=1955258 RepID=UPI002ED52EAE
MPALPDFPRFLEVQTVTACNAACTVCPHPEVVNELPRGRMSDELFGSIVEQCVDHQEGLTFAPYLNGEPLIDRRLAERIALVNDRLPAGSVEVSTNVSMLDDRRRAELAEVRVDDLRLSVFGFTPETHARLMPGLRFDRVWANMVALAEDDRWRRSVGVVGVVLLDHPAVTEEDVELAEKYCADNGFELYRWGVLDRSRNVASFSNNTWRDRVVGCEQNRHRERLHVRFDGTVILCCQDWRAEIVVGNLRESSIQELWHGPVYTALRRQIEDGRPGVAPELCRRCKLSVPG